MDLSIIVVSYNTKKVLKDCLLSIKQHISGIACEIIVVDNASRDGSVEMLRDMGGVDIIANPDNRGFARANNQGLRLAKGKYKLLLNSDTLIFDNSLKKIFDYMEQNPGVGLLGCKVLNQDQSLQYSCMRDPSVLSEWVFFTATIVTPVWDPFTRYKFMRDWDHRSVRSVDCLSGCFLWIRRDVVDEVGGLDEDFFMYYEDFEYCRRVRRGGRWQVIYYPDAAIIHLGQMSASPGKLSLVKDSFEAARKYFVKCQGRGEAAVLSILCWITWQAEILVLFLLSFHPKARKKMEMFLLLAGYAKD